MNKQKIMKWALPALLMSCMTFELMPGSVRYFAKDTVTVPEATWNFFSTPIEGTVASCLILAGVVTFAAMVLALVAVCFKKNKLYKTIGWCSLAASALAAVPYMAQTEGVILQPNVVVLLILLVSWLVAMAQDKKNTQTEEEKPARRL